MGVFFTAGAPQRRKTKITIPRFSSSLPMKLARIDSMLLKCSDLMKAPQKSHECVMGMCTYAVRKSAGRL